MTVSTLPTIATARGEVERISAARGEPRWLLERRLEAWDVFEKTPMPDPHKDEEWRRMSFTGLDLGKRPVSGRDDLQLSLEDGKTLPAGVTFALLGDALREHPDLVREHLAARVLPASRGKFEALSAALFGAGAFVHVPKNTQVETTLVIHARCGLADAAAGGYGAFRRNVIVIEPGASARVLCVEESLEPDAHGLVCGATEIVLGAGARLRHATVQVLGGGVWSFDTRRALVGRDATIEWVSCDLGSRVARNTVESQLSEPGGRAQARSMIFGDKRQFTDLGVRMLHAAPHTESDMLVRAALNDSARAVYRGHVDIKRGSKGTNSQQKEAVLLLSPDARSDAIPSLFIDENDLKAGHGATAGRVDERQLFYLMSRGLPKKMAERLIIEGFFMPLIEQIAMERFREELLRRIDTKIGV